MRQPGEIARVIDHAILHPALQPSELESGLELALELGIWAVCVKPCDVKTAVSRLQGYTTCVCSVVAFPHGNAHAEVKMAEAKCALEDGATEIDYVINISQAIAGEFENIEREMSGMNQVALGHGALLKVIFENAYLDDTTKTRLCKIAKRLGVAYVKTSTGFASGAGPQDSIGASIDDVELMVRECAPSCKVKASGGVRSLEKLERFLDAGASRIGTSSTREIVAQARRRVLG
jgi:deoxyribose-phosphate aldolase